jgi:hypothetical protein
VGFPHFSRKSSKQATIGNQVAGFILDALHPTSETIT